MKCYNALRVSTCMLQMRPDQLSSSNTWPDLPYQLIVQQPALERTLSRRPCCCTSRRRRTTSCMAGRLLGSWAQQSWMMAVISAGNLSDKGGLRCGVPQHRDNKGTIEVHARQTVPQKHGTALLMHR